MLRKGSAVVSFMGLIVGIGWIIISGNFWGSWLTTVVMAIITLSMVKNSEDRVDHIYMRRITKKAPVSLMVLIAGIGWIINSSNFLGSLFSSLTVVVMAIITVSTMFEVFDDKVNGFLDGLYDRTSELLMTLRDRVKHNL